MRAGVSTMPHDYHHVVTDVLAHMYNFAAVARKPICITLCWLVIWVWRMNGLRAPLPAEIIPVHLAIGGTCGVWKRRQSIVLDVFRRASTTSNCKMTPMTYWPISSPQLVQLCQLPAVFGQFFRFIRRSVTWEFYLQDNPISTYLV